LGPSGQPIAHIDLGRARGATRAQLTARPSPVQTSGRRERYESGVAADGRLNACAERMLLTLIVNADARHRAGRYIRDVNVRALSVLVDAVDEIHRRRLERDDPTVVAHGRSVTAENSGVVGRGSYDRPSRGIATVPQK
jgi:hypothetical protein